MLRSAEKIVRTLQQSGHTAYFAGGAVRDMLLDRRIADIDIATSATPTEVEKIFPRTHPVGREFGVMLVLEKKHAFEVATFRGEADYDGRRPGRVFFAAPELDAQRRDFTINGMFYDPLEKKIYDYTGGQHDLKLKVVRFIGDPSFRIQEDHLRLLRAVRFKNLLNFEYEPKTAAALKTHAGLIQKISGERIRDELNKMFEDSHRGNALRDLESFDLLRVILPELEELHGLLQPTKYHREGDAYTHTLGSFASLPARASSAVAWATLLHDIGKAATIRHDSDRIRYPGHAEKSAEIAEKILHRLRFDNATRAKIVWLINNHMLFGDLAKMRPAHRHRYFIHPWFPELIQVCLADIRGTRPADYSLYRQVVHQWKTESEMKLLAPPKPLLTGNEVIQALHIPKGPQVGRLTKILHDAEVEGLVKTRAEALEFLNRCLKR